MIRLILFLVAFISCQSKSPARGLQLVSGSIHHGTEVASGESISSVALTNMIGEIFCSGTLIAPDIVLTAAHCLAEVENTSLDKRYVFVGTKTSADLRSAGKYYAIKSYLRNELYFNSTNVSADMGLVFLQEPVEIAATDLPRVANKKEMELFVKDGQQFTLTGFGTDENGKIGTKKKLVLELDELQKGQFYHQEGQLYGVSLGNVWERADHGDSGSGIFTRNDKGELLVMGITSACNKSQCVYPQADKVFLWLESIQLAKKATEQLKDGQINDARLTLNIARKIYPAAEVDLALSALEMASGNYLEAQQAVRRVLALNPENVLALRALTENAIKAHQETELQDVYYQVMMVLNTTKSTFRAENILQHLMELFNHETDQLNAVEGLLTRLLSNPRCSSTNQLGEKIFERYSKSSVVREYYFLSLLCLGDARALIYWPDHLEQHAEFLKYLNAIYIGGNQSIMEKMDSIVPVKKQRELLEDDYTWYVIESDLTKSPNPAKLAFFQRAGMIRKEIKTDGSKYPFSSSSDGFAWPANSILDSVLKTGNEKSLLALIELGLIEVDRTKSNDFKAELLKFVVFYDSPAVLGFIEKTWRLSDDEKQSLINSSLNLHAFELIISFFKSGQVDRTQLETVGGDLLALAIVNNNQARVQQLFELGLSLELKPQRLLTRKSLEQLYRDRGWELNHHPDQSI